jgi:hypothetical protein
VSVTMPNTYTVVSSRNSAWSCSFQILDDDKVPADLLGKTFTFVARVSVKDQTTPPPIEVTSTASTAQGTITVDLDTATLLVIVNKSATNWSGGVFTLWMNAGLSDQVALVQGPFLLQPTATP